MNEDLEQNLREAEAALDAAQMAHRRALWQLAIERYEATHPAAELVVMLRAADGYDSQPMALYDGQGALVADLVGEPEPFGSQDPCFSYERMILDAGHQVHDHVVQRAIEDTVARHADDDEAAVAHSALGTIYLCDVRAFLAGESPHEIALGRKVQTGPDSWRSNLPQVVVAAGLPVAVTIGIAGYADHQGVVFPKEPSDHVHPTVWVGKYTLRYLNAEANHGEPDHEPAGERRLEAALIPPTMDVRAVHDELAALGYDQGLALYAAPSSLPIVIRDYHVPADQQPPATTVEEAATFTVDGSGPGM